MNKTEWDKAEVETRLSFIQTMAGHLSMDPPMA
jgi:hypothetical protein